MVPPEASSLLTSLGRANGEGRRPEIPLRYIGPALAYLSWPCTAWTEKHYILITKGVAKGRNGLEEYLWACHGDILQISLTVPR